MFKRALLVGIISAVTIAACGDDDPVAPVSKKITFRATMTGASEVPVNTSAGTGTFTAILDTSTNVLTYTGTFTGVGTNVASGHLHGPAAAGANAGVILNFATLTGGQLTTGATTGTVAGTVTLNASTQISTTVNGDSLRKLILAGLTYVNIHTTGIGAGEIRGQLLKQ